MSRLAWLPLLILLLASGCGGGSDHSTQPPAEPACAITPASIDFGTITLGAHRDTTVTIKNAGGGTLTGAIREACGDFAVVGSGSYSLTAGQSAVVTVRFAPGSAGAKSCTLSAGTCGTDLTGIGASPVVYACNVNPTAIDFGTVAIGQVVDRTFTLTNLSSSVITGAIVDTSSAMTIAGTSSYNLAPTQGATFVVRFTPVRAGTQGSVIQTGQPGCPTVTCTALAQSACAVTPTALDFGVIASGTSLDRTFSITNTGSGTLVSAPGGLGTTSGCGGYTVLGPSSYALSPGQSVEYTVRFEPVGEGLFPCTILTGNPACPTVNCTGEAQIACNCATNPTMLAFGDVIVGNQMSKTFTIGTGGETAIGGTMTAVGDGLYLDAPGGLTKSLGYTVNANTTKSFAVVYQPPALGMMDGFIAISQTLCSRVGSPCDTVRCSGHGILTSPPPACAVSTTSIDFGMLHSGQVEDTTFTITNVGGGTLSGAIRFLDSVSWPFVFLGAGTYSLAVGQSQSFTVRYTAPSVAPGHTVTDVRQLDLGAPCTALGPIYVQATAIP